MCVSLFVLVREHSWRKEEEEEEKEGREEKTMMHHLETLCHRVKTFQRRDKRLSYRLCSSDDN